MIVYLVGFLCTYILCKFIRHRQKENEWSDVGATFVISLFSWLSLIILLIMVMIVYMNKSNFKPPKWL